MWITRTVPPEAWQPTDTPGLYTTERVLKVVGHPPPRARHVRLIADGVDLKFLPILKHEPPQEGFAFLPDESLLLVGMHGEIAPMQHTVYFGPVTENDDRTRVNHHRIAGDGLSVLPGMREDFEVTTKGETTLRFATATQRGGIDLSAEPPIMSFRVSLDGEPLFEHAQHAVSRPDGEAVWHAVALPPDVRGTLSFEVDGPPGLTAFMAPVIAPVIAPEAERDRRPDIIVFLADTFRADNLRLHGNTEGLTPNLDLFAQRCARYLNTWSPASWTLPAHCSMFSGLFPTQHYAMRKAFPLSGEAVTIAEKLAAAGYRTGAITDAGMVTHLSGLDQGFEWWDQSHPGNIGYTIERAESFLAADDGRPVFLFVQSYSVHSPYQVSEQTQEQYGDRLRLEGHDPTLLAAVHAGRKLEGSTPSMTPAALDALDSYENLYRGGVVDLDRGFGEFLEMLERVGIGEEAYLVFTSDHGEAFDEHGVLGHATGVWEEIVRIPMLISGPGVTPGDVTHAASLLDIPHTLTDMAGASPEGAWLGTSLLGLEQDRPVFSHIAMLSEKHVLSMAMIDGDRKLITETRGAAVEVGEVIAAFDLATDPGERENLLDTEGGQTPAWVREVEHRLRPIARMLMKPIYQPFSRALSPDQEETLRQLGYADF